MNYNKRKDSGDGTFVLVMMALPMLVMVMTFVLNIAQTNADKNELNSLVQNAAQAGVAEVNAYGSLNKNSVNKLADTFYSEGLNLSRSPIASRYCEKDIKNLDGTTLATNAPYVLYINLDNERGMGATSDMSTSMKYVGPFNSNTKNDTRLLGIPSNYRFQIIQVEAYVNIRSYWAIPGTDPCRTHRIDISATTFGSSQDIDYHEDYNDEAIEEFDWQKEEEWARNSG